MKEIEKKGQEAKQVLDNYTIKTQLKWNKKEINNLEK